MNELLVKQAKEFLDSQNSLSAMCNITALINQEVDMLNWVGYYLYKNRKLTLGPFQGKVACSEIEVGKGVCGVAYQKRMLLNINDVHQFEGHIACDPNSNSELVVPIMYENNIYGVIDLDSPQFRRFGTIEEETITEIANLIGKKLSRK